MRTGISPTPIEFGDSIGGPAEFDPEDTHSSGLIHHPIL